MYNLIAVTGGPGELAVSFLPMIAIFGIFYFLVIRPQKKQQQNHETFISNLKSGDKVITQGGMFGKVVSVDKNTVTLDLGNGKVKVLRTHISGPQKEETSDN